MDLALIQSYRGKALQESELAASSFPELFARRKTSSPFLDFYGQTNNVSRINFNDANLILKALAYKLANEYKINMGTHVALIVGNSIEAYLAYSALLFLGAVLVPLNPDDPIEYLKKIAEHAETTMTIAVHSSSEKARALPGQSYVLDAGQWLEAASKNELSAEEVPFKKSTNLRSPAAIFYTSGTTGNAKGVLLSVGNLLANLEGTRRAGHLTAENVLMSCLPLFHVNAFNFSFLLPWYLGCRIVYQSPYFQPNFWKVVAKENVDTLSLVPPVIRALSLDSRDVNTGNLSSVISAASPLHPDVLQQFQGKYSVPIHQAYGLSETVNFTLFTPLDLKGPNLLTATQGESTPSAGSAVWGNEVFLLDAAGNTIESEGLTGEVVVRGWNVFSEYYKNPEATREAFTGNYFHTGDLAYFKFIGGEKFYFLQGRMKEIIKRAGEIIYLAEIDATLKQKGWFHCCAVGFANLALGEELGLFVARSGDEYQLSDQELIDPLIHALGYSRSPKVVVRGDTLPQTSVGKIKRKQLEPLFAPFAATVFKKT